MPYNAEHSCRLREPQAGAKTRRDNNARTHNGKKYDVIYQEIDGKMVEQSYRYPKKDWTAEEARSHCETHKGTFESATIFTDLKNQQWAILPDELRKILTSVEKDIEAFFDVGKDDRKALEKRGAVGIIQVKGPIFGTSNYLTKYNFATSIQDLEAQLDEAHATADVSQIEFHFDTPGGVFTPSSKFAEKMFSLKGKKPTCAIINGMCASAGYLLASSCDSIKATDETNLIGGIGVVLSMSKRDDDEITFISSNAPRKNPDPTTQTGIDVYQGIVNRLESVMLDKIARNRGVTVDYVKANFGKGNVLLAEEALKVNMIDNFNGGKNMDKKILMQEHKAVFDEIFAEGKASVDTKALTDQIDALNAKIAELTPKPVAPEMQVTLDKVAALEKQVLEAKLTGVIDDVKANLLALHGAAPSDMIEKIAGQFKALQAKIDTLGAPKGSLESEGNLEAAIDAKTKELIATGMSATDAYVEATKLLTK